MNLYIIFHLNLAFSSVEEEHRPEVLRNCYWPLLHLACEHDLPFGIEATGYTLETAAAIDPAWVEELRRLTTEGTCEFIGSGYAQIIGPLVPARVNDWNQKIGKDTYEKKLGIDPKIALVNEMVYSTGMVEYYLNNGYHSIIMEWNNPRRYHPEWRNEWRYFPQRALGAGGQKISVIWADSIAFQKFQRYAHGEYNLDEYIEYLKSHDIGTARYFPLYANDVEIFDFRPRRYKTEADLALSGEWTRIAELFKYLKEDSAFQIIAPSEVLAGLKDENGGQILTLESPEQPIPVKKQEKYNINRWALSGRNDLYINTKCYGIYHAFKKADPFKPAIEDWKELCYLWSSDFRTHITPKRWEVYLTRLDRFCKKWQPGKKSFFSKPERRVVDLPYTGNHFKIHDNGRYLTVETDSIRCVLNKLKGLAVEGVWFKNICPEPLIGTLPHGYYDDISLGADFFSGHTIIEKPGKHKITDLQKCEPEVSLKGDSLLCVMANMQDQGILVRKEYNFDNFSNVFTIKLRIEMPDRKVSTIHPFNITFIPSSFKKDSLYYATHNGGKKVEKFRMDTNEIYHAQTLSSLISARHGLGATEGFVFVGDKQKKMTFHHDQTKSAVIPSVHFSPLDDGQYFLRLQYSAQEVDETFNESQEKVGFDFFWTLSASDFL